MKTFKSVKWDADADNNTFQELFKKKKKNKSSLVESHKKTKKKFKNIDTRVNKSISNFINKESLQSSGAVNLINTPLSNENMCKRKRKKLKKIEKHFSNTNVTNFLKTDAPSENANYNEKQLKKSSDLSNLDKKLTSNEKTKKEKKALQNWQKNSNHLVYADSQSGANVQSNNSTFTSTEQLSKIERKKLKKLAKRLQEKRSPTEEKITADTQTLTKSKKRRLKNMLKKKTTTTFEQTSNVNNNSDVKQKKKKKRNKSIFEGNSAIQEYRKSKNNQQELGHKNVNLDRDNSEVKDKKKKLKSTHSTDKVNTIRNSAIKLKTDVEDVFKLKKHKNLNEQSPKQSLLVKETLGSSIKMKQKEKLFRKLKEALEVAKEKNPVLSLREKMMEKLKAARFRFINEQIYTTDSKEAQKIFQDDPDAFKAYHNGYRKQVKHWPLNPLDIIISSIKKMPKTHVVADFGCGDAMLSKSVNQKVHSFDLVALDDSVIACDMSKVPLGNNSVDVAVFCLSLMGTNLRDYLIEANRVTKIGGLLKIAEVESRFEKVEDFVKGVSHFGFKNVWKDQSHNLFHFLDFKKERDVKHKNKLPTLSLLPCLYKKR